MLTRITQLVNEVIAEQHPGEEAGMVFMRGGRGRAAPAHGQNQPTRFQGSGAQEHGTQFVMVGCVAWCQPAHWDLKTPQEQHQMGSLTLSIACVPSAL
jgi:hypothetical protein